MGHSWHKLSQSEDSLDLLSLKLPDRHDSSKTTLRCQRLCSCLRYTAIAVISFVLGLIVGGQYAQKDCTSSITQPSFLDSIDRSAHRNHTNIPVYAGSKGTIWQRPPSPEVDAAWHALTRGYPFLITEDDMHTLGKDPARYISVPQSFGYGEKKFITRFAHTHNIHCLDRIRRRLYREYYGSPNTTMDWIHTNHCLHAVLDHLTCHVQYDVLNYIFVEGEPTPDPELTYNRQCRDLDAMIRWSEDNRVDKDLRVLYIQPTAEDEIFPPDGEFRALEEAMDRDDPDQPSMSDRRKTYSKAFEDAMKYWQDTGQVPTEEREWK